MCTIFWAGDSTVQYNSYTTYPQTGIGQVLHLYLKPEVKVANHAKNGRSTKSFIDESRLIPIYDNITKGDFLFVQFGHNDEKKADPNRYTEPDKEFSVNLEKFANVARNKEAIPVFITPLERRCFLEDHTLGCGDHAPYAAAVRRTAQKLGAACIDLTEMSRRDLIKAGEEESRRWYMHLPAGRYDYYPEGLCDNTHLQYEGAVHYAGCIAEGLRKLGGIYSEILLAQE